MFLIFLLVLLCLFIIIHDLIRKRSNCWKKLSEFPGDAPLPLIGNGLQLGFNSDGKNTYININGKNCLLMLLPP